MNGFQTYLHCGPLRKKRNAPVKNSWTAVALAAFFLFPSSLHGDEPEVQPMDRHAPVQEVEESGSDHEREAQQPIQLQPSPQPVPSPGEARQAPPPAETRSGEPLDPEVIERLPAEIREMFEKQEIPAGEDDPYWHETVERALEELSSDDPETRRSAVMLLGKYPVEPAQEAVTRSLEDADPGVRMAALVSLFESPRMYSPHVTEKILLMAGDPDVSIRRIASGVLPNAIQSYPLTSGGPGQMQVRRRLPAEVEQVLQDAYRDEDNLVRRNMASNHPRLQIGLSDETLRRLLLDEDERVAIQAITWGVRQLSEGALEEAANEMATHPSEIYRRELARSLRTRRGPATERLLEKLREDESPEVALEAGLVMLGRAPDAGAYSEIVDLFRRAGEPPQAATRLIDAAASLGAEGEPLLREWANASNSSYRQRAATRYLNQFGDKVDRDFLRKLLSDRSSDVRQRAMRFLLQNGELLDAEFVRELASSRHRDIRQQAPGLAGLIPSGEIEDFLMNLLLDHETEVRVSALREIAQRRIDGWKEIMGLSLMDDEPAIQLHAAEWLLRHPPTPEVLDLLADYIEREPRSPLRQRIESHLEEHQFEETDEPI